MGRISIDVTDQQHKKLKALAALQGKSIKEFVLESTLGGHDDPRLAELEALLDRRIEESKSRKTSPRKGQRAGRK